MLKDKKRAKLREYAQIRKRLGFRDEGEEVEDKTLEAFFEHRRQYD